MKIILYYFFFLFSTLSFCQTTITGKIIEKSNQGVPNGTITVTTIENNLTLAYAISDETGKYVLTVNSEQDSLQLHFSSLGYKKITKNIANLSQEFNFVVEEFVEELKEVVITNSAITKKGDTINYSISSFKNQDDRVISDIIAKLPGIEVQSDGKILYQGRPIQKYYIEGLDLLEGKYNLANENLPVDAVSKVQILENHQPIQVLDSLVFSDRASLNIKLKKGTVLTGVADLGLGLSPILWDGNVTPIILNKKQQILASYQSNNIGSDISKQIQKLTIEDLFEQIDNIDRKRDWVDIIGLASPPFSENKWLDNNAHLLSVNYLRRLKNGSDIKVNFSYLNDVQKQIGNTETTIFTQTDTITIIENKENELFFNSLNGNLILEKNTKQGYFKNNLEVKAFWDSKSGNILSNGQNILQQVENPFSSYNNNLKWLFPINNKIVQLNSTLTYTKTPQSLRVLPSQFENLLTDGISFDGFVQNITLDNFHTKNTISYTANYSGIVFTPKLGFLLQSKNLESDIEIIDEGSLNSLSNEFVNGLKFNRASFFVDLSSQYSINQWNFELKTPFKLQTFNRQDDGLSEQENLTRFTIEPDLYIKNKLNAYWEVKLNASIRNTFGDVNELYYGFLINNYRSIRRYDIPISQIRTSRFRLGLSYSNPVKSLFFSSFYSISRAKNNLLLVNNIEQDGSTFVRALNQDNFKNIHTLNARASKFVSKLNTTLSLTPNLSFSSENQFINDVIINLETTSIQLSGAIDSEITNYLSFSYKNKFSFIQTQLDNESLENIRTQEHLLRLNLYPNELHNIGLTTEYYTNDFSSENRENYFLNLNYNYTLGKSKIDLGIKIINILNTQKYTTAFNDSFSNIQSTFQLRPRQLIMSIGFSF